MATGKFDELRYDRSVSDEFLNHFLPGGFAASLLEYARARYPIDFQLRKSPKSGQQSATLYVGMTAVLTMTSRGAKGLTLSAHPTHAAPEHRWNGLWETAKKPQDWSQHWSAVEDYLELVIPAVMADGRHTRNEGL